MTAAPRRATCWTAILQTLAIVLVVSSAAMAAISAGEKPRPPCGVEPFPAYPTLDAPPVILLWTETELAGWSPPACTAWQRGSATLVVGLAGHFRDTRDADAMLARIGAISSLRDVRYWSITDKQWNTLFTRASALEGSDPKKLRGDFSASEMGAARDVYFLAADNRSRDDSVSRLRVREANREHLVIETSNVTPLRWMFLSFAAPGDLQTWYFLDREAGESWRFYSLTRVLYSSSFFARFVQGESYVNREAAMYRHLAGIPTDRDPPPAR
jgi:hypothetical protein